MKPRVMSLVIFTCTVGLLTSPNQIALFDSLICIFFVAIGAGAAGTLNMWYEADLDILMTRTCLRPIPTGKINKDYALIYGIILSIVSIFGLYYFSNILSATLLFITIAFYVFVSLGICWPMLWVRSCNLVPLSSWLKPSQLKGQAPFALGR